MERNTKVYKFIRPGARDPGCRPLPELDDNADVADDDGDEGEHKLCDVGESSVYQFVRVFPGLLAEHLVGGGIFYQLHEQSIAGNMKYVLILILYASLEVEV